MLIDSDLFLVFSHIMFLSRPVDSRSFSMVKNKTNKRNQKTPHKQTNMVNSEMQVTHELQVF